MELWTGMCGDRFPCFGMLSDRVDRSSKREIRRMPERIQSSSHSLIVERQTGTPALHIVGRE
jgi:hypothetical protein